MTSTLPIIKDARIRILGITTLKRSALMPELPTVAEQGLPGFDAASWFGIMAPAKTPRAIIDRLYRDLANIVNSTDMKNFILAQGAEPALMDPAEFAKYLHQEIIKWRKVVKSANLPPQ